MAERSPDPRPQRPGPGLLLLPQPRHVAVTSRWVAAGATRVEPANDLPRQGYRLIVGEDGDVVIQAADAAGAFYARKTLGQLNRVYGACPVGTIEDWPDFEVRGVMLDISRDKVPAMAALKAMVDSLADQKINHLQLYMEHTFAYRRHADVWRAASPLRPAEMAELARYCADRHIELTANQNCLGHFERWLRIPRYRSLAIVPEGRTGQDGTWHEPTTLDPANPAAFALVRSLLAELLPHIGGARVNVGLDEPWELPASRAGEYLDWIDRLRAAPELNGREMLIWGDVLQRHPELVARLPKGVTVLEWGYDSDHPFAGRTGRLAAENVPFWVCPGTNTWSSVGGRLEEARRNILSAAEAGRANGARGILVTDWGDRGHLQQWAVSEMPLAYGAAVGWALDANRHIDLEKAVSTHVFADPTGELARAVTLLGGASRRACGGAMDRSVLAEPLYDPDVVMAGPAAPNPSDVAAARDDIARAVEALGRARPATARGREVRAELRHTAELLSILADEAGARLDGDGSLGSVPEPVRREIARRLAPVIAEHQRLWLRRNRPGGMHDSLAWLTRYRESVQLGAKVARGPGLDSGLTAS